jgi:hypothetical protein
MKRERAVTPSEDPPRTVAIGPRSPYTHLRGHPLYLDPGAYERVAPCRYGACRSECCGQGAWVSPSRRVGIAARLDAIRRWLAPPFAAFTIDQLLPYGGTWPRDRMHPGEPLYQTRIAGRRCCFVTAVPDGHSGCAIHKYADAIGLDWMELKPSGCVLFPLKVSVGPAGRVRLFRAAWRDSPCCRKAGADAGERLIDLQRGSVGRIFDLDEAALDRLIRPAGTA